MQTRSSLILGSWLRGGRLFSRLNVVTRPPGSNTSRSLGLCRFQRIPNAYGGTEGQLVGNAVMLMGESCAGSASERRTKRWARQLAVVGLLLGVVACNPVDTWRDLTGVSRNDPDPDTTPNTKNLAAGEASDYPNLATVPPPPERALTAAERDEPARESVELMVGAAHAAWHSEPHDVADPLGPANRAVDGRHPE